MRQRMNLIAISLAVILVFTLAGGSATALSISEQIVLSMDEYDVSRGSLILVNNEHSYIIPQDTGLSVVSQFMTPYYRADHNNMSLSAMIVPHLNAMIDDFYAKTRLDTITIVSAFRNYEYQQSILDERIALLGRTEALRWASKPGHSEHHTGLAVDFGIYNSDGVTRVFHGTGSYAWFKENSYKYGFILRYQSDKTDITGTAFEPWHYRYVGTPHAYFITSSGLCLEEYIELIRQYSSDKPYSAFYNGELYTVFHTDSDEVIVPAIHKYDVSGDNISGYIVTVNYGSLEAFRARVRGYPGVEAK